MKINLSVALATFNEERNIKRCLDSVKGIADEIVIVDGRSSDNTVQIAKEFGAKVIITDNQPIFHINKQKAIDACKGEWILQMDADEEVSKGLASEIKRVTRMSDQELSTYQEKLKDKKLFLRHQKLLEERDGHIGTSDGFFAAFFIPRSNYFLGKFLRYGGVYPDGVIRLIKRDKAYLPCKSVHEQFVVEGRVGWLQNPLLHYDSPTFKRYLIRNSRYIDLIVTEMREKKYPVTILSALDYIIYKPLYWFLVTLIRHKGILDGWQGVVFSFCSALRFARAYLRYIKSK